MLTAPAMVRLSEAPQLALLWWHARCPGGAAASMARSMAALANRRWSAWSTTPCKRKATPPSAATTGAPRVVRPNFLNADSELSAIAGIAHNRSARLCLYGPPGTGKTAYGRWLAQTLEMPLLVKRASDLQIEMGGRMRKKHGPRFSRSRARARCS